MVDYLALTDGCRLGAITVSDFAYFGMLDLFFDGSFDVPASDMFVTPSLPFGASSLRLHFLGSWSAVDISYTAEAEAAWIRQFNLRTGLGGTGGAHLSANGLFTFVLPFDPQNPDVFIERPFDTRSFDPISVTTVDIHGLAAPFPHGSGRVAGLSGPRTASMAS
jgi:hypothetical protein